ncbi:MAG TPA: hypothetical protein VGH89_01485 [Pseudonocardia sp.]|jgi:hypothetical protein
MPPAPGNYDRTDQAALFGAALAAILTLVFGEGPWEPLGMVFGVVLLSVVAAYYRPQPPTGWVDSITKASAFASVLALSGFILLAYPIQQLVIRPRYPDTGPAAPEPRICSELGTRAAPATAPLEHYEDCIGKITTSWGWLVCLILFVLGVAGWYAWTRPVRRDRQDYRSFRSALGESSSRVAQRLQRGRD